MATVVAAILSVLLLLQFLNCPVHNGIGGLLPAAMERTLKIIDQQLTTTENRILPPCDARGNAL